MLPNDSLTEALLHRRSRRFAQGMHLDNGPLEYKSPNKPQPLDTWQEAALAFAACGITGHALGDLPYQAGGHIMKQFVARTAPSADALHTVAVFLTNDQGTWLLRRPQDYPLADIAGLVEAARRREWLDLFHRSRIQISDSRTDVPRELPFVPPFNHWSANVPGSSYFIPVNELTALYINILLSAFHSDFHYFVVDDRRGFQPAGIAKFAKSKGGRLEDDPRAGRLMTVTFLESWLFELAAVEQGAMVQNLGLMAHALGIGGFPHFAAHPFGWTRALGFRMQEPRFSKVMALHPLLKLGVQALGRDIPVPTAVGLEREGEVLIKPYCPPYYPDMATAVKSLIEAKFARGKGAFRDPAAAPPWKDAAQIQAGIPEYSQSAIDATIAYCEYVYRRYGRFPAHCGPFRTVLAYQAHRLDDSFYEKFYR